MTDEKKQDQTEQRESVDYDLVRQGMDAAERAAIESRARSSLKPKIWAVLLIVIAILLTRFVSGLT
ncbi:hypothetical protein [Minwuia sp.]|uniref:hypothetical protein n=1 Tax=Minwuia sp. TaxID=2493630 RepID=UPI003A90891A